MHIKLLNIILYTNEQTSIKLKLFNIWNVITEPQRLLKLLGIFDIVEIMYYRFTAKLEICNSIMYFIKYF